MLKAIVRFLLGFAVRWALFAVGWFGVSRLSTPSQILVILAAALIDLIRMTGDHRAMEKFTRRVQGPITLVGPLQPWQTADGSLVSPVFRGGEDYETPPALAVLDDADKFRLLTGVWNPALVRPLHDHEEDSNG